VTISGTTSVTTSGGISSYSSLKITSANTYTLTASSSGITPGTYSLTIIAAAVTSMTLTRSVTSISGYLDFTLTASLFDQIGISFTESSTISLTSDKVFGGQISLTTTTGSASFTVHGIESGLHTFTASCSGKSATTTVTILSNVLKFTSISPSVIFN
jgi:hypothetical protein